ncbi:Flagellar hook-associated protein 2 [Gammaproteobacteria bacterium]
MAGITVSGIGSGLDVNSLVTQLVAAERQPTETRLNKKEAEIQAKLSALGTVKGAVSSFQSAVSGIRFSSAFTARSATSANTSLFTASATDAASLGSHSVEVKELAQAHKLTSNQFDSSTDPVGQGILTFQFGSFDGTNFTQNAAKPTQSITIDSTNNSLQGIRDAVNSANFGVAASIVDDGSKQRLVFASKDSGLANGMKITVSDSDGNHTDTNGLSQLAYDPTGTKNLSETQEAKDASLKVDGLNITRSSNTISGALDGVVLNLVGKSQTGVGTTLSIGQDSSKAVDSVKSFVDKYNGVMTAINNVASFDKETGKGGILLGDQTVRTVGNQMRGILTSTVSGVTGNYNSLASIGIKTQRDGTIELDSDKLQAALSADPIAIGKLFGVTGTPTDALVKFSGYSSASKVGTYAVDVTQLATQGFLAGAANSSLTINGNNDELSFKINNIQSGNIKLTQKVYASGSDLAAEMQSRINSDTSLKNAGMSVTVGYDVDHFKITSNNYGSASKVELTSADTMTNVNLGLTVGSGTNGVDVTGSIGGTSATGIGRILTGAGDASGIKVDITGGLTGSRGQISFSRGIGDQLYSLNNRFLSLTGTFASVTSELNKRSSAITSQRTQLDARMTAAETRYRNQFVRLDSMISKMKATGDYLTQQLSGLSGN